MIADISHWISIIGGSTLLIVGTVGAVLNILVFMHSSLRSCSCSWYILVGAFFDLITLDHALLLRILSDGFSIDLISLNTVYCKLRFYTGQIASFVPITLTCLASVDRWASTCRLVRIRRWSSIRVARWSMIGAVLLWSVLSVPNLLVYQLVGGICKQTSLTYNDYTAFFLNPILYGFLPIAVLGSFGYATYVNIRQLTNRQRKLRGNVEEQLTKSIILQCASFTISQVPYTLWNLYLTFTGHQIKSAYRLDLETLLTQFTRLLFYFNYVSTFYINLLASNHVRKLTRSALCLLKGQHIPVGNRIHPLINTVSKSVLQRRHSKLTDPTI